MATDSQYTVENDCNADNIEGYRPFAKFPKRLIRYSGDKSAWSKLSHSAKAVFPVLLRYTNERGIAFPGREKICEKSGIDSEKTITKACKELADFRIYEIEKYVTATGKYGNRYVLNYDIIEESKKSFMKSYHHIIDDGHWAYLGKASVSQSLYWTMRVFARSDNGIEICEAEREVLCDFSDITRRSYPKAIRLLSERGFIQDMGNGSFAVYA